jgi:hypothetical protein
MSSKIKLGIGSALSTFGAIGIVLSLILEWTAVTQPWGFLLGFALGVASGLGATLAITGDHAHFNHFKTNVNGIMKQIYCSITPRMPIRLYA